MNTKEIPNNSPTPEQIASYMRSGYSHSEAFSAALRENQRAEERAEKRMGKL